MLTLPERVLLVKLYYRNGKNAVADVREFHRLKKQQRETMSERVIDIMVKFECTEQLGILTQDEEKKVSNDVTENIATAIAESLHGSVSLPIISHILDEPYSTV